MNDTITLLSCSLISRFLLSSFLSVFTGNKHVATIAKKLMPQTSFNAKLFMSTVQHTRQKNTHTACSTSFACVSSSSPERTSEKFITGNYFATYKC